MSDNYKGQYLKAAADVMILKDRITQLETDLADARKEGLASKQDQARYCYAVENMLILSEEDGMFLVEKKAADKLIDAAIAAKGSRK